LQEFEGNPHSVSGSIALFLFNRHNPRSNFIKVRDHLVFAATHNNNEVLRLEGCCGFNYMAQQRATSDLM
jgi:hypothetical protein